MPSEIVRVDTNERAMDRWVTNRLVEWAAGSKKGSEHTKANLRRELEAVAADLAGPAPTPVERLLAETAALNWFALRLHEAGYAHWCNSDNGPSVPQSEHCQRRIDRAHRRFLATLKTLATVRKLGAPAVQINQVVGQQQVNVATSPF